MTNLSLKEQLKALSADLSSAPTSSEHEVRKPNKQKVNKPHSPQANRSGSNKPVKQKPAWLEQAQYGVELLKAYFPKCFKDIKEIQPVKIGIKQDLAKFLSTQEQITIGDKACMVSSLAYYVNSVGYHKSVVAGATRIDLDGNAAGTVTEEEAQYSAESRKSKLQKKQGTHPQQNNAEQEIVK